jgi:hypothetical protein
MAWNLRLANFRAKGAAKEQQDRVAIRTLKRPGENPIILWHLDSSEH